MLLISAPQDKDGGRERWLTQPETQPGDRRPCSGAMVPLPVPQGSPCMGGVASTASGTWGLAVEASLLWVTTGGKSQQRGCAVAVPFPPWLYGHQ